MKIFKLIAILSSFFLSSLSSTLSSEEPINNNLWIEWDSAEGVSRLQSSEHKDNVWKLMRFYESQFRPNYCAVTSSVIALNALSIKGPVAKLFTTNTLFNQEEFFELQTVMVSEEVQKRGISLEELSRVLADFPVKVTLYKGLELSEEEVRNILVHSLKNRNQIILANYIRTQVGQKGDGHWSPIAAYDEGSDSFLILDVARFKYPPAWIDAKAMIGSMRTGNLMGSRGFLILENESEIN